MSSSSLRLRFYVYFQLQFTGYATALLLPILVICALLTSKHPQISHFIPTRVTFDFICCVFQVFTSQIARNMSHISKSLHLHDFAFLVDNSWFGQSNLRLRKAKGKISLPQKMVWCIPSECNRPTLKTSVSHSKSSVCGHATIMILPAAPPG
jgi:hypothetical protein